MWPKPICSARSEGMRASGVQFMDTPETYYELLPKRMPDLSPDEVAAHVLGEMQQLHDAGYRSIYLTDDHFLLKRTRWGTLVRAATQDREMVGAIAMSEHVQLSLHPGALSQTLAGMEGMLRMPHGCFEQASSSNYPNTLVLAYLEATGDDIPSVASRAR